MPYIGFAKFVLGFWTLIFSISVLSAPASLETITETPKLNILSTVDISDYVDLPHSMKIDGNYAYILGSTFSLKEHQKRRSILILDIKDESNPGVISNVAFDNVVFDIAVSGNYLYAIYKESASGTSGMLIIDLSDHSNPEVTDLKSFFPTICTRIVMDDDEMYVISNKKGLLSESRIFTLNRENPLAPEIISSHFTDLKSKEIHLFLPDYPRELFLKDDQLFIVGNKNVFSFIFFHGELQLIKTQEIRLDRTEDAAVYFYGNDVDEYVLYVAGNEFNSFADFDVNNDGQTGYHSAQGVYMTRPSVLNQLPAKEQMKIRMKPFATTFRPEVVVAKENLVCLLGFDNQTTGKILCVDFHDITNPSLVGSYDMDGVNPQDAVILNDKLYVVVTGGKLCIFELPDTEFGFIQIQKSK